MCLLFESLRGWGSVIISLRNVQGKLSVAVGHMFIRSVPNLIVGTDDRLFGFTAILLERSFLFWLKHHWLCVHELLVRGTTYWKTLCSFPRDGYVNTQLTKLGLFFSVTLIPSLISLLHHVPSFSRKKGHHHCQCTVQDFLKMFLVDIAWV